MRVFTRGVDQGLIIGRVEVSVLEVGYDTVRLGISDPFGSPHYREEVLHVQRSNDEDDEDEREISLFNDRDSVMFDEDESFSDDDSHLLVSV